MAKVECRDIFNAVYIYVRGSYISSLFSSKTKTKISITLDTEDDTEVVKREDALNMVTTTDQRENAKDLNETVMEKVERDDESEVADKIRMDLEEKFPFALASVCSNLAVIDKEYRKMRGYENQPTFSEYIIETSEDFPLSERFVFPAIMYVSSIVLMDIDEKRSDDFYDKYASAVSKVVSELQFEKGVTVEKYPY